MKSFKTHLAEGRPSQRHPLEGHEYHKKTDAQLEYIAKDAHKAAEAMKGHNTTAENKYRDQANDSATVRYWRKKNGMPDWYKKKYSHMKEETEIVEQKSAKAGVIETDVFGIKAYHAKCLEPGCKFESKRFSSMKKAQEAAKKHAEKEHFVKEEIKQVDERCWPGYKSVPGKKPYSLGSCTKEEVENIGEASTYKAGSSLMVPHKGKMVPGKVVRYDSGKGGYSPAYVVDIGEYESKTVPAHSVKQSVNRLKGNTQRNEEVEQIEELSTELLGRYKKAAGASASAADKAGDFEKGNKRFAGINKATLKQFKNFVKKEEVEHIEEGETIVTPKKMIGEPSSGSYAYERKYGKYTAKGTLRKRPNPNKPPVASEPVKEEVEELDEVAAWQRKEGKNPEGGLNRKGIESYRRENPGSKLSMAVTTKPSKLKPGSKAANRRKSFCARMGGMKKRLTSAKTANDPDSRINKALRKWNC